MKLMKLINYTKCLFGTNKYEALLTIEIHYKKKKERIIFNN